MLRRDEELRIISGVCSGLSRYLAIDSLWIRLAFILLAMTSGIGIVLYLLLALLIPSGQRESDVVGESISHNIEDLVNTLTGLFNRILRSVTRSPVAAVLFIGLGAYFIGVQFGFLRFPIGWVLFGITLAWIVYLIISSDSDR